MQKLIMFLSIITLVGSLSSCAQKSSNGVTPSGYNYTFNNDESGDLPNPTDWVAFTIKIQGSDGKVFQDIGEGPNMPVLQIPAADAALQDPNPILEVLKDASVGDSITVIMPIDSLPNPSPEVKALDHIEYVLSVKEIKTDKEHKLALETQRLEQQAKADELKAREADVAAVTKKALADYKSGKLKLEDKNGVEVHIIDQGNGTMIDQGNRAGMQYYGVLKSNGEEFDNSFKRGRAFAFTVGRGEVIQGWDKGLLGLQQGGKAVLFIPYDMAYGEADRPGIPGKSDLVFYVEVEDVN